MDLNLDDDGIKYPSIDDLKEILKTKHTMLLNGEYDLPTRAEKRLIEHHKDEYSYYKLLVCFIEQYKIKNFVLVECNETDVGITNKMVQFEKKARNWSGTQTRFICSAFAPKVLCTHPQSVLSLCLLGPSIHPLK